MMKAVAGRVSLHIKRMRNRKRRHIKAKTAVSANTEQQLKDNPYLQLKCLWDDMYGSVQVKLENSYRIIAILSFTLLIAIVGLLIVAGETKIKPVPFVLRGDALVTTSNLEASTEFKRLRPKLALYFARHFIENARVVTTDGDVNQSSHINSMAFAGGEALSTLKTYFNTHNADVIAEQSVVDIEQLTLLHESNHTLVARWVEVWRDPKSGVTQYRKRFIAQMTYHFGKPSSNDTIVRINPLGFVISYLSWSVDQSV